MAVATKLALVAMLAVGAAVYFAYAGADRSWQYYLLVDESVGSKELIGKRVRVRGEIAKGTLKISEDRRQTAFKMQGEKNVIQVSCPGPLPDNLAENMDVVVEGTLINGQELQGTKVITRCSSKYESK